MKTRKNKEVKISKRGGELVQREKTVTMARAFELLAGLPEDVSLPRRKKDKPQKRRRL